MSAIIQVFSSCPGVLVQRPPALTEGKVARAVSFPRQPVPATASTGGSGSKPYTTWAVVATGGSDLHGAFPHFPSLHIRGVQCLRSGSGWAPRQGERGPRRPSVGAGLRSHLAEPSPQGRLDHAKMAEGAGCHAADLRLWSWGASASWPSHFRLPNDPDWRPAAGMLL